MADILNSISEKKMNQIEKNNTRLFGFWVYIMTDCILFAALFAVYAVLHRNVYTGPAGYQIFDMPYALSETLILLTSSFVCGLATLSLQNRKIKKVVFYFFLTFLLGAAFLILEVREFHHLAMIGDSFRRSGFLSSYFTLVGTHGLHITIGLLWIAVMLVRILKQNKLSENNIRRLKQLAIFWHFLDVVWIFIFTIVYLFGALRT
jgi:cytochrome o ubiquinol oxidase subunit 3